MASNARMQIRVVAPCPDPTARGPNTKSGFHCTACKKDVIDFTRVTEARAAGLVEVFGSGGLCGRVREDEDGNTLFAEPPRRGRGPSFAATAAALSLVGCGTLGPGQQRDPWQPPAQTSTLVAASPSTSGSAPQEAMECAPQLAVAQPAKDGTPTAQDQDGDGVADADDLCVDVPAGTRPDPAKAGCPTLVVVVRSGGVAIAPPQVNGFAFGGSHLTKDHKLILDEIARVLSDHPEVKRVVVEGHASGDETTPDRVSLARAQSAVTYLLSLGVDGGRLTPEAKGTQLPLVPVNAPDSKKINRRVSFRIVERSP